MNLTLADGIFLVRLAREAVAKFLTENVRIPPPKDVPQKLKEKRGVFVTIQKIEIDETGVWRRRLRGCIGFPLPIFSLVEATINAAIAAAVQDPRFPPMTAGEIKQVVFEVSVLTPPQKIIVNKPTEYPKKIKVGRDGLIVKMGMISGLLLPQVAVEYGWDEETFLSQTCVKAGLLPDAWLNRNIEVYKFQAQIFAEIEPEGDIIERRIHLSRGEE